MVKHHAYAETSRRFGGLMQNGGPRNGRRAVLTDFYRKRRNNSRKQETASEASEKFLNFDHCLKNFEFDLRFLTFLKFWFSIKKTAAAFTEFGHS